MSWRLKLPYWKTQLGDTLVILIRKGSFLLSVSSRGRTLRFSGWPGHGTSEKVDFPSSFAVRKNKLHFDHRMSGSSSHIHAARYYATRLIWASADPALHWWNMKRFPVKNRKNEGKPFARFAECRSVWGLYVFAMCACSVYEWSASWKCVQCLQQKYPNCVEYRRVFWIWL